MSGTPGVNVTQWAGGAVPAPNIIGEPLVDVNHWRGTQPNFLAAGRVDGIANALGTGVILSTSFASGAILTSTLASGALTQAVIDATFGNAIADNLLDRANAIETGATSRQAIRYIFSANAGVLSGAGTNTVNIFGGGVTTSRISAVTDASGNRSAVTLL